MKPIWSITRTSQIVFWPLCVMPAYSDEQLDSPGSDSAQAESANPPRGRRRRRKASKRLRRRGVGLAEERVRSVETVIQHGRFEAIARRTK